MKTCLDRSEAGTRSTGCPPPDVLKGRIVAVVDGDTIKVRRGRKTITVRMIGIDTPETKKPGTAVECGGPEATKNLKRLAFHNGEGRRVTLTTDPSQDRKDRYGHLLAYAKVSGGKTLQVAQLKAGWATVYVYDNKPFERYAQFRDLAIGAYQAERGAWGKCDGDFHQPQSG